MIWPSCSTSSIALPMGTDQAAADAATFKRQLAETIPHLRAFARSLCGRPDFADDLVQEAMLKAWAARDRFEPGTNLRAWTFTILRNCYLTEMRRNKFVGDYDEGVAERTLQAPMGQEDPLHLAVRIGAGEGKTRFAVRGVGAEGGVLNVGNRLGVGAGG